MKGKRKETKPEEYKQQTEYVPKSIALHTLGVSLVIGAKPNSKQSKVLEINDEYIGVAIAAPAREGQANEQLISHLASVLALKKNMLYLDKGSKSRNKVVIVQNKDISPLEAYHRILADFNS